MKTNFIGYSERGMMDALVFSFMEKPEKLQVFLQKSIGLELAKDDVCDLYLEHSLSEFGTPDLVIIVSHEDSTKDAIFVEAKVKAYGGLENSLTQFMDGKKDCKKFNGYSSNLFCQLYLKNLLVESNKNIDIDLAKDDVKDIYGDYRKIGNNGLVKGFNGIIKECKTTYYVAIIPETEDQIKHFISVSKIPVQFEINYISWKNIVDCVKSNLLNVVYEYNKILIDNDDKK
jgi:hypothetical protein